MAEGIEYGVVADANLGVEVELMARSTLCSGFGAEGDFVAFLVGDDFEAEVGDFAEFPGEVGAVAFF